MKKTYTKVMKYLLLLFFLFAGSVYAATPPANTHSGGTGVSDVSQGSILFGGPLANVRMATSSALQYNDAGNRLSLTYASTTGLSATFLCLSTDCRTAWPSSVGSGLATTSPTNGGELLYYSAIGAGSAKSVATTSIGCTGNISCTGFTALGAASTISFTGTLPILNGGTGTTTSVASQLYYGGGNGTTFQSVGTSTLTASSPLTGSFTQIGTGGSVGLGTVGYANGGTGSTTAPQGQLLYGGATAYQSVATGTVSAGSSAITVTAGRAAIGGALSIDCATAGSGQNGCLSSTDWTTFNAKQAGGFQIATTSTIAISQVAYYTKTGGVTTIGGVGTTSVTAGTGLTGTLTTLGSGDAVALAIPVVVSSGGTGTTTSQSSQLIYGGGAGVYQSVATTSVTCSGSVTCTGFNVLGTGAITISGSGGGTGLSTTSPTNGGELLYYSAIGAGSAKSTATTTLGGGTTGLTFSNSPVILGSSASAVGGTLVVANGGTGTTTAPSSQILYGGGSGVYQSVATSSIANGTNITVTNGSSAFVLGAQPTINLSGTIAYGNGGTGTTTGVQGQLAYYGASAYQSVATSSGSCSGLVSCSGFTVVGSVAAAISATYDAWSHPAAGTSATTSQASTTQFSTGKAYFGLTATTTIDGTGNIVVPSGSGITNTGRSDGCTTWASGVLTSTGVACGSGGGGSDPFTHAPAGISSATTSALGIGSTTPFSQLSVSSSTAGNAATSLFAVASDTNATLFNILGNGNVGVGTTSPASLFSVNGAANFSTASSTFYGNGLTVPNLAVTGLTTGKLVAAGASGYLQNVTVSTGLALSAATNNLTATLGTTIAPNELVGQATFANAGVLGTNVTQGTFFTTATTSETCTGLASCTAHDVLTGGGAINVAYDAWSHFNSVASATTTPLFGFGTSSPGFTLEVATSSNSTTFKGQLALTDNNAGTDLKHWVESNVGGVYNLGTTTDLYATSSPSALTILNNGDAGFGTSTPGGDFAISNPTDGGSAFIIGTNAGATQFVVSSAGNVGVGTTSPGTLFGINGIASYTTGTSTYLGTGVAFKGSLDVQGSATSTFAHGLNIAAGGGCFSVNGVCLSSAPGLTGYDAWTHAPAGISSATTSALGIGSTTPFSQLSVSSSTAGSALTSLFGVASDTNATLFNVLGSGNVGIGTTSPYGLFSINAPATANPYLVIGSTTSEVLKVTSSAIGKLSVGTTSPWAQVSFNSGAPGTTIPQFVIGSSTATQFVVTNGGNIGIGTTSPPWGLSIDKVTGTVSTSTVNVGSSAHPSCLQLYDAAGKSYQVIVNKSGVLVVKAGGCN